jgi:hypothetical protein
MIPTAYFIKIFQAVQVGILKALFWRLSCWRLSVFTCVGLIIEYTSLFYFWHVTRKLQDWSSLVELVVYLSLLLSSLLKTLWALISKLCYDCFCSLEYICISTPVYWFSIVRVYCVVIHVTIFVYQKACVWVYTLTIQSRMT